MVWGVSWGAAVLYLLALAILHTEAGEARKKDREVSGLYPFPRVGRSYNNFQSACSEYVKRQGLIPFPRVGRSGLGSIRRLESLERGGFWLGPRPGHEGRPSKVDDWTLLQIEDPPAKGPSILTKEVVDYRALDDVTAADSNDPGSSARLIAW